MRKLYTPIDCLFEECKNAINDEIIKKHRKEAIQIIALASVKDCREFLGYYKSDQGNICCLVLDKMKRDLVADGISEQLESDVFGKPYLE